MAGERYTSQVQPHGPSGKLLAMALSDPLSDTIGKLEQLGQRAGASAARENAQASVLAGDMPGDKLPLSSSAIAYNEAAHEAYQAKTEQQIRVKVADLGSRFNGRNPTDPQSFAEMFDASSGEILASVPEHMRAQAGFEIQTRRADALAGITARAQSFQFERDKSEIAAGVEADVAEAGVLARDGGDPGKIGLIYSRADGRIDKLVALGVINPGQAAIQKEEYRSSIKSEAIFGEATRGGNLDEAYKEATTGGKMVEGLTLQQRDRLAGRLSAAIGHRNALENHAIALQAKAVAQGDRDLNFLTRKLDMGVPLSDAESGRIEAYNGNKLAASPVQLEEARAAVRTFSVTRTVATMTPQQVDNVRAAFSTAPPPSIEEAIVRKKVLGAMDARDAALKDDPMGYAMSAAPETFKPVVLPSTPEDPSFDGALAQLASNSDLLHAQYGVEASPFTKEQRGQVATWISTLEPGKQALVLGKVVQAFGDRSHLVMEDLSKQGATVLGYAGWAQSDGDPELAQSLIQGLAAKRAGLPVLPTPLEMSSALGSSSLPAAVPSPTALGSMMDAAEAWYADRKAKGGNPTAEDALAAVGAIGGTYNGSAVLLPRQLPDSSAFGDRVEAVDAREVAQMAGPKPIDPSRYNTPLKPADAPAYQKWAAVNVMPGDSGVDYDYVGAFYAGEGRDSASGHMTDRFKKPGHPTFSVFSQYAPARPDLAGSWDGDEYVPGPAERWARETAQAIQRGEAKLTSVGNGQYRVDIGQTQVRTPDGRPFVLDVTKIQPKRGPVSNLQAAGRDLGSLIDAGLEGARADPTVRTFVQAGQKAGAALEHSGKAAFEGVGGLKFD